MTTITYFIKSIPFSVMNLPENPTISDNLTKERLMGYSLHLFSCCTSLLLFSGDTINETTVIWVATRQEEICIHRWHLWDFMEHMSNGCSLLQFCIQFPSDEALETEKEGTHKTFIPSSFSSCSFRRCRRQWIDLRLDSTLQRTKSPRD